MKDNFTINETRALCYEALSSYYADSSNTEDKLDLSSLYKAMMIKYDDYLDQNPYDELEDWGLQYRNKSDLLELSDSGNKFIYLASPFFSQEEIITVCRLEYELEKLGFTVYSPSRDGRVLSPKNDDIELRKEVFKENMIGVDESALVVGVIDNRDPGTMFEVGAKSAFDMCNGYSKSNRSRILTYSAHNYGVNLMLINSTLGHYVKISELLEKVQDFMKTGKIDVDEEYLQEFEVE